MTNHGNLTVLLIIFLQKPTCQHVKKKEAEAGAGGEAECGCALCHPLLNKYLFRRQPRPGVALGAVKPAPNQTNLPQGARNRSGFPKRRARVSRSPVEKRHQKEQNQEKNIRSSLFDFLSSPHGKSQNFVALLTFLSWLHVAFALNHMERGRCQHNPLMLLACLSLD